MGGVLLSRNNMLKQKQNERILSATPIWAVFIQKGINLDKPIHFTVENNHKEKDYKQFHIYHIIFPLNANISVKK